MADFDEELGSVKWFERAKQEAGLGAFEVRNHTRLIRHGLCSRLAMLFPAEQVAEGVHTLVWKCWNRTGRSWSELVPRLAYWQHRNAAILARFQPHL